MTGHHRGSGAELAELAEALIAEPSRPGRRGSARGREAVSAAGRS